MNILALDTGTTSMRGILFNEKGETLFTTSCQTPLNYPGEYIEQSPHRLSDSLIQICKTVCAA